MEALLVSFFASHSYFAGELPIAVSVMQPMPVANGVCSNAIVSHGTAIPACLLVNFTHYTAPHYTTILPNSM